MAATIKVCDKTSGKITRYSISDVQLSSKIAQLKSLIEEKNASKSATFDIIYCGEILQEDQPITTYDIKDGVTVYILPSKQKSSEPEEKAFVMEVVSAMQSALSHPAYRNTVDKVLSSQKTMDDLLAAVPGLTEDPTAQAMLQEPELLNTLADSNHLPKILERHPCVGRAAVKLAEIIKKEMSQSGASGRTTARSNFSLDQMSDDEDMPGPARQPVVNVPITGEQLAAALLAATGAPIQQPAAVQQQQQPPTAPPPSGDMSNFFRQALQAAASGSPATPAVPPTSTAVTEANLQSLRDMGITDEAVARQALEATNGNIEAAVNLIFGDGL